MDTTIMIALFGLLAIGAYIFINRKGGRRVSSVELKKMIQEGALILDVRSPEEFRDGHYPGAVNIPVGELEHRIAEIGDKSRSVVIYCASGMRSARAWAILHHAGFGAIVNAGGLHEMPR